MKKLHFLFITQSTLASDLLYERKRIVAVTINKDIEKIKEEVEDVSNILFSSDTWIELGLVALKVFFIILLSIIVVKIGKSVISRAFKVKLKGALRHSERRETTLIKLLQNTLSYVVYFAAILA